MEKWGAGTMSKPINGLYLTNQDFASWQDPMSNFIESYETCTKGCPTCNVASHVRVKTITFVVTEVCNLRCSYCYQTNKTQAVMSKQIAKDAVDFIFNKDKINDYYDFEQSTAVILDFIGGEPLLEIDLINYIVEYFKFKAFEINHPWATNYRISMSSNGTLYQTEKVQKFLSRNKGQVSLAITIDGNKELHDACRIFPDGTGSYDIVESALVACIKETGLKSTKITLCPENVMHLNVALQNVWSLGLSGAHANCVFEEGWVLADARILYDEMIKLADYLLEDGHYAEYYCSLYDDSIGQLLTDTKNWCGGNGQMLAIGTDGKCFPCLRFMQYSLNNVAEQPIGDIYNGIDSVLDNKWLQELKLVDLTTQCQHEDNKKCLTCPIASGCALCVGFDYDTFGDANHKATFICEMHQARVLANVYYWNKLYRQLQLPSRFKLNVPEDWACRIITEDEFTQLKDLQC
jgi:uncharacterized protein